MHQLQGRNRHRAHRLDKQGQRPRDGCEGTETSPGQATRSGTAERALRELLSAKGEVEYGVALVTATNAEPLVRQAQTLFELAVQIVRLGR